MEYRELTLSERVARHMDGALDRLERDNKDTDTMGMNKRIYVGNLPWSYDEDAVREIFLEYGNVYNVHLPTDRETGRARGFGFVEMDPENADTAIQAVDGTDHGGRTLRVNEALPRDQQQKRGKGGHRRERHERR